MAGIKRKEFANAGPIHDGKFKRAKIDSALSRPSKGPVVPAEDDSVENSITTDDDGFKGLLDDDVSSESDLFDSESDKVDESTKDTAKHSKTDGSDEGKVETTNGGADCMTALNQGIS